MEDNYNNEIFEVNEETSNMSLEELIKMEEKSKEEEIQKDNKNEKKKKNKINLTKKQKIIIIVSIALVLIVIISLILFFIFKEDDEEKSNEPTVVVEKDNYRYENGVLVFLNTNEKEIGKYNCTNKDVDKCYVTKNNIDDTFDRVTSVYENGEEIIKSTKIYQDKYVFVTDGDIIYLYNIVTGEKELELQNIKVYSTERDLVVIENENSLYGLIEITSDGYEYLIRCSYNDLGIVNTNEYLLLALDKDKQYITDENGKVLSKEIKNSVKSANKDFIVAEVNNSYSLYSYDYEELLSDYDYISLHDSVVALVKSKRLYLIDNNLNKLYEDGIRLTSTDYNKKYVYDSNNKLKETKKSYEIEVSGNNAKITIDKNTKQINLLEGSISSKYSYMSYFDGKLYFYSDKDKSEVIGLYSCNNENKLNSSNDALSNCSLYTSEELVSGIYNNEYVIVKDGDSYYLYNIKENKVKGIYSEIEIVSDKELNDNIKLIYTSSSYIIAKSATGSNKGNYGVLEINSEKVQGKIGFKYSNIEIENNYYLLTSVDNTYSIYNKDFDKISNEFSYIKLYDNYYVGINNNKLNVYSYKNTLGILTSDISVINNEYEIDFENGFSITTDNKVYNYDKDGKIINNKEDNSEGVNNEE